MWTFRNMTICYGELLAPRPTPKVENHHLSAVRDGLFNIFTATFHIGGRSSIHNLSARHAEVKGTHLSWNADCTGSKHSESNNSDVLPPKL